MVAFKQESEFFHPCLESEQNSCFELEIQTSRNVLKYVKNEAAGYVFFNSYF